MYCNQSGCRLAAQLVGASGNFFSRITTFFRASIDFLKENFEKNEIFKIFDFVKFLASGVQPSSLFSPQLEAID